jgi:hypothetical protein
LTGKDQVRVIPNLAAVELIDALYLIHDLLWGWVWLKPLFTYRPKSVSRSNLPNLCRFVVCRLLLHSLGLLLLGRHSRHPRIVFFNLGDLGVVCAPLGPRSQSCILVIEALGLRYTGRQQEERKGCT